jgi:TPR repeat protein
MADVGDLYRLGLGVRKDDAPAAGWYLKSAEAGFVIGMYQIGIAYRDGIGVPEKNV